MTLSPHEIEVSLHCLVAPGAVSTVSRFPVRSLPRSI